MMLSTLLPGIGLGLLKGMLLAEIISKPSKGKGYGDHGGYGHGGYGHHEPEYGYSQRQGHAKVYPQSDYLTDFQHQNYAYDGSLF